MKKHLKCQLIALVSLLILPLLILNPNVVKGHHDPAAIFDLVQGRTVTGGGSVHHNDISCDLHYQFTWQVTARQNSITGSNAIYWDKVVHTLGRNNSNSHIWRSVSYVVDGYNSRTHRYDSTYCTSLTNRIEVDIGQTVGYGSGHMPYFEVQLMSSASCPWSSWCRTTEYILLRTN